MKIKQSLQQYVSADSPAEKRLEAAQHKISLSTQDEITVLCILTRDPVRKIALTAKKSLDEIPEPLLLAALSEDLDHEILKVLSIMLHNDKYLMKILYNKNTDDDTRIKIGATATPELIKELLKVSDFKTKMPKVYGAMEKNTHFKIAKRDFHMEKSQAADPQEETVQNKPQSSGGLGGLLDDIKGDQETFKENKKAQEHTTSPDETGLSFGAPVHTDTSNGVEVIPVEAPDAYKIGDVEDTSEDSKEFIEIEDVKPKNTYELIKTLSVGQKIKLALTGGKEARDALIKDTNKLVSGGVIKNPQISDNEIIKVASTNGTSEDILRNIARNRQFMANYTIKHAIITNPKTPMEVSMRLMPTLNKKDKEKLSKSRSVPSAVSALAKKLSTSK